MTCNEYTCITCNRVAPGADAAGDKEEDDGSLITQSAFCYELCIYRIEGLANYAGHARKCKMFTLAFN